MIVTKALELIRPWTQQPKKYDLDKGCQIKISKITKDKIVFKDYPWEGNLAFQHKI
jgi:hypothetical protein